MCELLAKGKSYYARIDQALLFQVKRPVQSCMQGDVRAGGLDTSGCPTRVINSYPEFLLTYAAIDHQPGSS